MQRRSLFLSGLAALCGLAAAPAAQAHLGNGMEPVRLDDPVEAVRHGGRHHNKSGRRCRIETRRIVFTDRFGQRRVRFVEREVCR